MMDLMVKIQSVVAKCQMIMAILLTIVKPKNIFEENLFYSTYLSYFFQDMKPEPHIFCNVQN